MTLAEAIVRAKAGEQDGFICLFWHTVPHVWLAAAMLGCSKPGEAVVQIYRDAMASLDSLRSPSDLRVWIGTRAYAVLLRQEEREGTEIPSLSDAAQAAYSLMGKLPRLERLALLVLFFVVGVMKTCGSFAELKRPEHALKVFIRFVLAKAAVTYGLELMIALFNIVQGLISTIMNAAGFGAAQETVLPTEIVTAVEDCGFFESIPLWAVTLIGGLFITVLSFIMIMTVYGRFFKLYLYTAIAPVPLSAFAGEPSQNIGKSFIKSYAAVCLEGAIIVLACIIFSLFASSPPVVDPDAAAVTQVWSYVGELVFNMLVLVGAVKMADRVVREMMGL